MPRDGDWLIGRDRRGEAADRIYAAATDLIARHGYEELTIDALAAKVHRSPATIYRHAGGKAAIRDAVVARHAARILETVRDGISGLAGPDRIVTATVLALESLHTDPLAKLMRSMGTTPASEWVTNSSIVTELAGEMLGDGDHDPLAAQWLIRVFLALWCWPVNDPETRRAMVQRFLGPAYAANS